MNSRNCVRCSKEFDLPSHPLAHAFTICKDCHNKEPETLSDQLNYKNSFLKSYIV